MWQCSQRDPSRSSLAAHRVTLATTWHSYHSSTSSGSPPRQTLPAHTDTGLTLNPPNGSFYPVPSYSTCLPLSPLPQYQPKLRGVSATSPDTQLSHTLHPYSVLTDLKAFSLSISPCCLSILNWSEPHFQHLLNDLIVPCKLHLSC